MAIFSGDPILNESAFLQAVARRLYRKKSACAAAIRGWQAFDRGFGKLPIGLNATECPGYSGRIGFGWSMCIATPMVREEFGNADQGHARHWFSPYNFFNSTLAPRLEPHFSRVLACWEQAAAELSMAEVLQGGTPESRREALTARAHLLSMRSVRNWCQAAECTRTDSQSGQFLRICAEEIRLTRQFLDLVNQHAWLWENNCWHPHHTPLSQRGLSTSNGQFRNTFESKLRVMSGAEKLQDARTRPPSAEQ